MLLLGAPKVTFIVVIFNQTWVPKKCGFCAPKLHLLEALGFQIATFAKPRCYSLPLNQVNEKCCKHVTKNVCNMWHFGYPKPYILGTQVVVRNSIMNVTFGGSKSNIHYRVSYSNLDPQKCLIPVFQNNTFWEH